MTEYETIAYSTHDGVATIELARPDKLNALTAQMLSELTEATEDAGADPGIRVVLVRGQGRSFCSGLDVSVLGQLAGSRGARFRSFARAAQRPFERLALMEKPTIAAVHGHALGAGYQLALACDLRVVADDLQFAMLEVRYGIVPDLGGPHRLARLIGPARAKELIWSGRTVGAVEAERIGLVNKVVPAGAIEEEGEAYARGFMSAPPIPVSLVKSLVNRAQETPLETSLEHMAQAQERCIESDDHKEAVAAYLEQREPRFSGR